MQVAAQRCGHFGAGRARVGRSACRLQCGPAPAGSASGVIPPAIQHDGRFPVTASASKPRVGFVGLGNMGVPMSANLAKAGFPLTVFDIDAARAKAHASTIGATAAASLAELGAASDVVVTMLP